MPKCPKCGSASEMFCVECKIPTIRTWMDSTKEILTMILMLAAVLFLVAACEDYRRDTFEMRLREFCQVLYDNHSVDSMEDCTWAID